MIPNLLPEESLDCLDECGAAGIKIIQNKKYFCYGLDAVLLASFAALHEGAKIKSQKIADLGCGNGIVPLLLAGRGATNIYGLEVQQKLCGMADRSVALNGLEEKIHIVHGNIKDIVLEKNSFNAVTVNPPYEKKSLDSGPATEKRIARQEILCTIEDVVKCASALLKNSGRLYMIHRPARLDEILFAFLQNKIQVKEMRFVFPFEKSEATMVLLRGVKCGKPGVKVLPPLVVYQKKGLYTDELVSLRNSL